MVKVRLQVKLRPPREPHPERRPAEPSPEAEPAPSAERLRRLHGEWMAAPAMNDRTLRQWWDNLRLRWNCHSNAIEGSTLTYRDTVNLLVHGRLPAARDVALWEVEQMRGHDDAAYQLAYWLNTGHPLRFDDLHAIHRTMLVRPYPGRDGQGDYVPRYNRLGMFKTTLNRAVTATRVVEFAEPERVPILMHDWWERQNMRLDVLRHDPEALDPAWVLASGHWDFITTHPYEDGNGRMARWITNWMAMALAYPPIVIEQRRQYINCYEEQSADKIPGSEQDVRPLRDFIAARMGESLAFSTAVAHGRTDPSYANEHAELNRRTRGSSSYTLETTVPRLRPQDQRAEPDGSAPGDSRWPAP